MRYYIIIFIIAFNIVCSFANVPEYGLHVRSYPLSMSNFTSMMLENGKPIKAHGNQLDLSFKLFVRKDNVFGSVLRIIADNNKNIDLMFSHNEDGIRVPFLLIEEEVFLLKNQVREEIWITVNITLDFQSNKIVLFYDDEVLEKTCEMLNSTKDLRIAFGRCLFDGFVLDDVASVNIKDISLKRDGKEFRFWKMAEHDGHICYDEISGSPAVGKNTQWIIDDFIKWEGIYNEEFDSTPSIAFDSLNTMFFIATDKKVYTLSYTNDEESKVFLDSLHIKGGREAASSPNQMIFISNEKKLLSYNLTENFYSFFDFSLSEWDNHISHSGDHIYWNNTVSFHPEDSTLISFGGYGHYYYNNVLLYSYPLNNAKEPELYQLNEIPPRYSPASVIVDNKLYVFGGRGSPTGKQELFPRNYYDFYSIDLYSKSVEHIWTYPENPEKGDFIPSENMIYNPEDQCFYVFVSQMGGILMRIDTEQPMFEQMSLPIGIQFNTHYIYTNLFYAPKIQKIFVSILLSEVDGKSTLQIYEINYPPISVKDIEQNHSYIEKSFINKKYIVIFGLLVLALLSGGLFHMLRRKARARENKKGPYSESELTFLREEKTNKTHFFQFSKGCICLLGRFRIFNNTGVEKTNQLSPTLKSLLIVLILFSSKDSRGISGKKLIKLFWDDKVEESAKNNRNVYISKLRSILEDIEGIKIINENGFWRIELNESIFCDYLELRELIKIKDIHNIEKSLELLTRGTLLPHMDFDWMDKFKNELTNEVIDYSHKILKQFDLSDSLKLKIADILFQYDFLSEEALQLKCSILYRQSKIGLSKTVYDSFCEEYKGALNTEYLKSFMSIVQSDL